MIMTYKGKVLILISTMLLFSMGWSPSFPEYRPHFRTLSTSGFPGRLIPLSRMLRDKAATIKSVSLSQSHSQSAWRRKQQTSDYLQNTDSVPSGTLFSPPICDSGGGQTKEAYRHVIFPENFEGLIVRQSLCQSFPTTVCVSFMSMKQMRESCFSRWPRFAFYHSLFLWVAVW